MIARTIAKTIARTIARPTTQTIVALAVWWGGGTAARAMSDFAGTRALGMGEAGRGNARATEAMLLNPSGMSLGRVFAAEGAYQLVTHGGGHRLFASVTDSTSDWRLAMGLAYTFLTASPEGFPGRRAHEAAVSASYPISDRLAVGLTGKYLYVNGGAPEADQATKHTGLTLDAGVSIAPTPLVSIGVVGHNLRDLHTREAPMGIGYGVALLPLPQLEVVVDGFHDFTRSDPSRGVTTTVAGGAEYVFARRFAARLGGGRDGESTHGFLTAGLAALSEIGAVEVGARQDITGNPKLTFIGAGFRLFFAPPPSTAPAPPGM